MTSRDGGGDLGVIALETTDDERGAGISDAPPPPPRLPTSRRSPRSRRRRRTTKRQHPSVGGGQTLKIAAILLSAALSLCWMVAAVLVFHQEDPKPDSFLGMRRPLGALRHSIREYVHEKEVQEKKLERRDIGVAQTRESIHVGGDVGDKAAAGAGAARGGGVEDVQVQGEAEAGESKQKPLATSEMDTPLLIFTCERADYLRRTLTAVWNYHPVNKKGDRAGEGGSVAMPIVISQDGRDEEVRNVIDEFRDKFQGFGVPMFHMVHEKQKQGHLRGNDAYKALAAHFGWALGRTFAGQYYTPSPPTQPELPLPRNVIILEEDIEVAPDFFSFMHATGPMLHDDPTLLAVSAFNDNGKKGMVGDTRRLVRSDFFPGLGWMMPRRIWDEFGPKWPTGWWDDWMREPENRRGRHTIRPEVSRTFHFGSERGASWNQFGKALLKIELDANDVRWEDVDLSYLKKDVFRRQYYRTVLDAEPTTWKHAMKKVKDGNARVEYQDWDLFVRNADKLFHLMNDEKAGVPRTAFENIVEVRPYGKGGHLLFLTPPVQQLKDNFRRGKEMEMKEYSESIRVAG